MATKYGASGFSMGNFAPDLTPSEPERLRRAVLPARAKLPTPGPLAVKGTR